MIPGAGTVPHRVKSAVRSVAGRIYGSTPAFARQLEGKALILTYHRVLPRAAAAASFVQPGMYVTPQTFERHLGFLTEHFELVSFGDLLRRWQTGDWDDAACYCTVTFDDGWVDNHRYALPVLRAYNAPATIFLPTELIGTNEWMWADRLGYLLNRSHRAGRRVPADVDRAIEDAKGWSEAERERFIRALATELDVELPRDRCFLNWEEVREMSRHRVQFGSHTGTHAILTRLDPDSLAEELRRPLETLAGRCDAFLPVLAYPNGDHSASVAAAARAAGYHAAVTTNPGAERSQPEDLFRLKRIGIHEDMTRSIPLLTFHIARQVGAR